MPVSVDLELAHQLYKTGETQTNIAKQFGISQQSMSRIILNHPEMFHRRTRAPRILVVNSGSGFQHTVDTSTPYHTNTSEPIAISTGKGDAALARLKYMKETK